MTVRKINGVWNVDFWYSDPLSGQRTRFRRSTGKGTTKRRAEELERSWRAEVEQPLPDQHPEPLRAAFSGFAKLWFDNSVCVDGKPSYQRSTEQILRCHLVPFFEDLEMRSITPMMVQSYKAGKLNGSAPVRGKRTKRVLAPKTVNNHLGVLSILFRTAVTWGYADANPVTGVGLLALPPQEFRFWDRKQSEAFLDAVIRLETSWYPLFLCALRTGMRQGEILALRWDDVDFVKRQLKVVWNFTHGQLTTPKSGCGRVVPMSPQLAAALRGHRHLRSELVFCREDGSHLSGHCLRRPMARALRAAGVPRVSFHDLRHSFASQLVMAGKPLKAVQEYLGHADLSMTMRYAHLSPHARREYVACLDSDEAENELAALTDSEDRGQKMGRNPACAAG